MLFTKYANNPVFGGKETGTTFDAYVSKQDKMLRMDFSYREKRSCAVVFGTDGINWSEPIITLSPNPESGWENDINRNCVLYVDGVYKMWYTGQANGHSRIGCAESDDGLNFVRKQSEPVIDLEYPWEGESVMNPCVIYENGLYRMWYSAGETYEPNVIAYAESSNGIAWKKYHGNPIFMCEKKNFFEQDRIGGCNVIKADGGYIMFYIGLAECNVRNLF